MCTEFDIDLKTVDMYRFNMYHTYCAGIHGGMSIVLAIVAFAFTGMTWGTVETSYSLLYILFGIAFLIYIPITLYLRAKHQIQSSEVLRDTLHYRIDEEGIAVSHKEDSAMLGWKQVYKVKKTSHNLLIYSTRVNAYVLPMEQIADQLDTIRQLAKTNLEQYRYCIKEK